MVFHETLDVDSFEFSSSDTIALDKKTGKRLMMTTSIQPSGLRDGGSFVTATNFQVKVGSAIIGQFPSVESAIELYNSIKSDAAEPSVKLPRVSRSPKATSSKAA